MSELRLYEYEAELEACIDPETGEVDEEKLNQKLADRDAKLENCIRAVKSKDSLADMLRAEEKRLAERRKALETSAKGLRRYMASVLMGSKFWSAIGQIGWRKTKAVEISNESALLKWAKDNGQDQVVKVSYEVNKTELKKLLESDSPIKPPAEVARIDERQAMILK